MIWENVWAAEFAKSLRDADGILIANGRIPAVLVEDAMASRLLIDADTYTTQRESTT